MRYPAALHCQTTDKKSRMLGPTRQQTHEALSILRSPDMDVAYVYKYAPALMSIDPAATVDFIIGANPPLEPRKLLPALLRMREGQAGAQARAQALRYGVVGRQEGATC